MNDDEWDRCCVCGRTRETGIAGVAQSIFGSSGKWTYVQDEQAWYCWPCRVEEENK